MKSFGQSSSLGQAGASLKDKDRVLSTLREIAENAKRERDRVSHI